MSSNKSAGGRISLEVLERDLRRVRKKLCQGKPLAERAWRHYQQREVRLLRRIEQVKP